MPPDRSHHLPSNQPQQREELSLPPLQHSGTPSHLPSFTTASDLLAARSSLDRSSAQPGSFADVGAASGSSPQVGSLGANHQLASEVSRLFLSQSALLEDAAPSPSSMHHVPTADRSAERQYYWLEQFHEHLEQQQQEASTEHQLPMARSVPQPADSNSTSQPAIARSMPTPVASERIASSSDDAGGAPLTPRSNSP